MNIHNKFSSYKYILLQSQNRSCQCSYCDLCENAVRKYCIMLIIFYQGCFR